MLPKILVAVILIIVLIAPWMTRDAMNEVIIQYYPNCDKLGGKDPNEHGMDSRWFPFGRRIVGCNEQPIVVAFDPRISAALVSDPVTDNEESEEETEESENGFWDDVFYVPQPQAPGVEDPNPEDRGVFN